MEEFQKLTECPSLYNHLEKKTVGEILTEINAEDHKVADARACSHSPDYPFGGTTCAANA